MLINYFLALISSFTAGLVLMYLLRKVSLQCKLLVSQGIPLIGGIAIALAFILGCLTGIGWYRNLPMQLWGLFLSSLIMLFFGIVDDLRELSVLAKFLVEMIAITILILFGIRTHIVYIGEIANIIITFIWILGISNAFNHLDVIDGLAAGSAILAAWAFFIISVSGQNVLTAILFLSLSGASLSFFLYNLPPAKTYMGNAGSHFLGFILAALALITHYAPLDRKIALLSPLLVLGLPILDTGFLILVRLIKKKMPFNKTNDHPALRLVAMGYSKKKTLWLMLSFGLFFSACGTLLSRASNMLGAGIVIFAGLIGLLLSLRMLRMRVGE